MEGGGLSDGRLKGLPSGGNLDHGVEGGPA